MTTTKDQPKHSQKAHPTKRVDDVSEDTTQSTENIRKTLPPALSAKNDTIGKSLPAAAAAAPESVLPKDQAPLIPSHPYHAQMQADMLRFRASPIQNYHFPQQQHPHHCVPPPALGRHSFRPPQQQRQQHAGPPGPLPPYHHHHHHQTPRYHVEHRHDYVLPSNVDPRRSPVPVHPADVMPGPTDSLRSSGGCTCKKSRCLKLYCQCFASSTTCGPTCKCQICHNTTMHGDAIEKARQTILDRNPSAFDDKFRKPNSVIMPSLSGRGQTGWMPRHHPYPPRYDPHPSPSSPNNTNNSSSSSSSSKMPPSNTPPQRAPCPPNESPRYWNHMTSTQGASPPLTNTSNNNNNKSPPPYRVSPPLLKLPREVVPSPSTTVRTMPRSNKFGCNCRRSLCLKKYCECFQNSVYCGPTCRCSDCKNVPGATEDPDVDDNSAVPSTTTKSDQGVSAETLHHHRRHVSMDHQALDQIMTSNSSENDATSEENRMAIMAAVAMTELFGGRTPNQGEGNAATDDHRRSKGSTDEKEHVLLKLDDTNSVSNKTNPRRLSEESTAEHDDTSTPPLKKVKIARREEEEKKEDDEEQSKSFSDRASAANVVHTQAAFQQVGSYPYHVYSCHQYPFGASMHGPYRGPPPPYYLHQYDTMSLSSPPPREYAKPSLPRYDHQHAVSHRLIQQPHQMQQRSTNFPERQQQQQQQHYNSNNDTPLRSSSTYDSMRASPTYKDVIRSSGLPKALSFRKICSKCGKIRSEHGELGFGNKCIFLDCGKCGAGIQMHTKVGVHMGILCSLTVEDGAKPGAAATYDRKIRELAARAELQKEVRRQKEQGGDVQESMTARA